MRIADASHAAHAGWTRFWFRPAAPTNLGLCRLLFCGAILLYFLRADYSGYPAVSRVFWHPIWLYRQVFAFGPPGGEVLAALQVAWKVSLAFACVGLLTRVATATAAVLGLYLLGYPFNYGYTAHMTAAPAIILGILALSRCGDAWSVDRLLAALWRRRSGAAAPPPPQSGEYTWPVRLVWVLLSLIFFAAGVSKLRHSGLAWVTSDTFAQFLRRAQYPLARVASAPTTSWGLYLAQYPLLCKLLAAGTIVLEVGYPLALLGARLRAVLVTSMLILLVAVRLLLGPQFDLLVICHLFWAPWDTVSKRLLSRRDR